MTLLTGSPFNTNEFSLTESDSPLSSKNEIKYGEANVLYSAVQSLKTEIIVHVQFYELNCMSQMFRKTWYSYPTNFVCLSLQFNSFSHVSLFHTCCFSTSQCVSKLSSEVE